MKARRFSSEAAVLSMAAHPCTGIGWSPAAEVERQRVANNPPWLARHQIMTIRLLEGAPGDSKC
jgi:hypothetical protein